MRTKLQVLLALPLVLAACSGGSVSDGQGGSGGGLTSAESQLGVPFLATDPRVPGALLEHPASSNTRSRRYIVDPNQGGLAPALRVVAVAYGRMVDVYDLDSGRTSLVQKDFVIDPALTTDGQHFVLIDSQTTSAVQLVILYPADSGEFRSAFLDSGPLPRIDAGLVPVLPASPGAPIFSAVPRDAAIVVRFDDLIDESSLDPSTLRVRVGVPAVVPIEVLLRIDFNYGATASIGGAAARFYSTRAIIDPAISTLDALAASPPIPVNPLGLPPAQATDVTNVLLRMPTLVSPPLGQNQVLRTAGGRPITPVNNGPIDPTSPTVDVVRAARSGGRTSTTGDPYNGFLPDDAPPRIVGERAVTIDVAPVQIGFDEFRLPSVTFASAACAGAPRRGDAVVQSGLIGEVVDQGLFLGVTARDIVVRLLVWPDAWPDPGTWTTAGAGAARLDTLFRPGAHAGQEACFVSILPAPGPGGIAPSSTFGVRLGDVIDPMSVAVHSNLLLTRQPIQPGNDPPRASQEHVVGSVLTSLDHQRLQLVPDLPLYHQAGQSESYYFSLPASGPPVQDHAGNALEIGLENVIGRVDPSAVPQRTGGRVSTFTSGDEDPPVGMGAPLPEWFGQILFDLSRGRVRPRPVTRFLALADRSKPLPGAMSPFTPGVQTPLTPFGAKLQALWRYVDFGFSLTDRTMHDLDVEGLSWAPAGGQVVVDTFAAFEIRLSHGAWAPDEYVDPSTLFPFYPLSGLQNLYDDNLLEPSSHPQAVVHPRQLGYDVSPGDLYVAPSGTALMPYPLNRAVPPADVRTYTWRDTSIPARAGPMNAGLEPRRLYQVTGQPQPSNQFVTPGNLQTIGLPLVLEFRTFPDMGALGLNAFDVSLAINSSSRPFFRAFSAGGINTSGTPVLVDPDLETMANGGFNPNSLPVPGQATFGRDSVYYPGAADMVVRVSRAYSIWFPALEPGTAQPYVNPTYVPPSVDPPPSAQPAGTSISFAFRGTDLVGNVEAETSALTLDAYGDHYRDSQVVPPAQPQHDPQNANLGDTSMLNFLTPSERPWRDDVGSIAGKRYYQVRVTFEANIFTGLTPELSSVGIAWFE